MRIREKSDFERFVDVFARRYREELMLVGLVSEVEVLRLYFEFKGSGKKPEEWFELQELS